MTTWILVLTLLNDWKGGSAIHSIASFKTRDDCYAAGSVWSEQQNKITAARLNHTVATVVCMEQRK